MLCPYCNNCDSRVLESRTNHDKSSIRRRRECECCKKRFTTYEKIELQPILVIKRSGRKEEYSRDKLFCCLNSVIHKRKINNLDLNTLLDKIEYNILSLNHREITTRLISELLLKEVIHIDKTLFIRLYSFLLDCNEIDNLHKLIDNYEHQNVEVLN